jgi:hypothetical protein
MIRPLTVATFLLACGSGLYLYQSKHEVQLLDRTIEKTVRETSAMREQSRLLSTEWNMLNDPERLRQFSDTYLSLKSINPTQYTSLADLGTKLPPPQAEMPAHADDQPEAGEALPPPQVLEAPVVAAVPPLPPPAPRVPVVRTNPIVAAIVRPPEARPAPARPTNLETPSRPVTATETREQHPPEQHAIPRLAEVHPDARPSPGPAPRPIILAAPRAQPVTAAAAPPPMPFRPAPVPFAAPAPAPAPVPYGGSLLGMARGSMPPVPRPTPVNATYNAN